MRKIPTLFVRDPANRRLVMPEVTPGCDWVLAGEGTATRKWDGACAMVRGRTLYRRCTLGGATIVACGAPRGFEEIYQDPSCDKVYGWLPVVDEPAYRWYLEAPLPGVDGTYELVGPKVNGNPEGEKKHILIPHGERVVAEVLPRTFDSIRDSLAAQAMEGIVYWHPDGRRAKVKRRDFGLPWPPHEGN